MPVLAESTQQAARRTRACSTAQQGAWRSARKLDREGIGEDNINSRHSPLGLEEKLNCPQDSVPQYQTVSLTRWPVGSPGRPSAEPTVGPIELRESPPGGRRGLSLLSPIIERRYCHAKAGSTRRVRSKIARCRLSQIFIAPGSTAGWQMAGTCLPP